MPPLFFVLSALLAVCLAMASWRKTRAFIAPLTIVMLILVFAAGCSGGGNLKNRTSTVTITGSSSGVSRAVNLTLTVN
jgi:lipopolysaccharide export LptBFGC system permease protein LptF